MAEASWVVRFTAIKFSGEDRRVYREKVQRSLDALSRMLREHLFEDDPASVGQEIELNLVDSQALPSMRNTDVLDAIADPAWALSSGSTTWRSTCRPGGWPETRWPNWRSRQDDLNARDDKARSTRTRVVMVGILPTLRKEDMHLGTLTASDRFRVLDEQIFAARGEDMAISIDGAEKLLTHADSITPEAACTSLQLHLQVNPESFANYWNAAQAAAAVQVALGADSRSCSAGNCGARPGSRCRAGHRHPAGRAEGTGRSAPGVRSASAGSPRCSTSSRRTCGSSRHCCRSARTKTRSPCSMAAPARTWPR